jgi:vanillate/3-O-methylgallate O-demethylase
VSFTIDQLRKPREGYFNVRFGQPEYTDWLDESMSWKEACYIGDWSFLGKRRFKGADAVRLLSQLSVNTFEGYPIGRAKHLIHTNENGKVIHEGILSRLGEQEFILFGRGGLWVDFNLRHGHYDVSSTAEDWFTFQVSGPTAIYVVERAARHSLRDIQFMHFGEIAIAGHPVLALRQGMAGEVGYELQGPQSGAAEVYQAILDAGRDFGIRRLGARVSGVNHVEACFPTVVVDYLPAIFEPDMADYLQELVASTPVHMRTFSIAGSFNGEQASDYYRSPMELGWAKNVKFDHEFVGREALEEEAKHPRRTIRTLVWNAEDVVDVYASLFRSDPTYPVMELPRDQRGFMYADTVLAEGKPIGVTTSRCYSYYFRQMLSLATLDVDHATLDSEVIVIWGEPGKAQKRVRAHVAQAPYKRDNRRMDVATL